MYCILYYFTFDNIWFYFITPSDIYFISPHLHGEWSRQYQKPKNQSLVHAAPFIVVPPVLPSLLRKRCLPCGAAAPFTVAPPLPSSSPPLIVAWFCLHCHAAAAFLVAPPLPSSSHCRSPHRRAAGSAFVVAPPVSYNIVYKILSTITMPEFEKNTTVCTTVYFT